jgi:hypothetical protein
MKWDEKSPGMYQKTAYAGCRRPARRQYIHNYLSYTGPTS